jgi:hypothetical protein
MADNTEMASVAMAKINEIQQKRQAGVNIAERLVTSSPEELSSLNRAMDRLNNNMAGNLNMGSTSDQRKESLDAFNMIAPFLGEQQNAMKANVLESMLLESGVGTNGMMGEVIQSLRNPAADQQMQEAIAQYKESVALQQSANAELAKLNMLIADNTAATSADKLASALGVKLDFQAEKLNDIASGIRTLVDVVKGKPEAMAAPGKAMGGLIYASAGQLVDFQPRGTDTVPAMLTPGEFVVKRSAAQRNLPLLNKINSGGYSKGGKVKYYADGGSVYAASSWHRGDDADWWERSQTAFSDSSTKAGEDRMETTDKTFIQLSKSFIDGSAKIKKEMLYAMPDNWFATDKSMSSNITDAFEDPPPKVNNFDSQWTRGISYGSVAVKLGGSAGTNDQDGEADPLLGKANVKFSDYPTIRGEQKIGEWPLLNLTDFMDSVFGERIVKFGSINQDSYEEYKKGLQRAINSIPNEIAGFKPSNESISINGKTIAFSDVQKPTEKPDPKIINSGGWAKLINLRSDADSGKFHSILNADGVTQLEKSPSDNSLGLYGFSQYNGNLAALL